MHGPLERCDENRKKSYIETFQFRIWQERTQGFVDGVRAHGLEPAVFYKSDSRMEYALQPAKEGNIRCVFQRNTDNSNIL